MACALERGINSTQRLTGNIAQGVIAYGVDNNPLKGSHLKRGRPLFSSPLLDFRVWWPACELRVVLARHHAGLQPLLLFPLSVLSTTTECAWCSDMCLCLQSQECVMHAPTQPPAHEHSPAMLLCLEAGPVCARVVSGCLCVSQYVHGCQVVPVLCILQLAQTLLSRLVKHTSLCLSVLPPCARQPWRATCSNPPLLLLHLLHSGCTPHWQYPTLAIANTRRLCG